MPRGRSSESRACADASPRFSIEGRKSARTRWRLHRRRPRAPLHARPAILRQAFLQLSGAREPPPAAVGGWGMAPMVLAQPTARRIGKRHGRDENAPVRRFSAGRGSVRRRAPSCSCWTIPALFAHRKGGAHFSPPPRTHRSGGEAGPWPRTRPRQHAERHDRRNHRGRRRNGALDALRGGASDFAARTASARSRRRGSSTRAARPMRSWRRAPDQRAGHDLHQDSGSRTSGGSRPVPPDGGAGRPTFRQG